MNIGVTLDQVIRTRGRRTDGFICYGQRPDMTEYRIPVIIVRGTHPGKTLLVDGAMHGDETEGSEAIIRLASELEHIDFKGTWIGVPALNIEAFSMIRRSTFTDEMNLNRVFPGTKDKYITHYLAAEYMDRVVRYADAVINFHGGGDVLHLEPLVSYLPSDGPDDEVAGMSLEMAKAFNVKYLWRQQNLPFDGITSIEYKKAYRIPTIIPEVGSHCSRLFHRERDIQTCYRGIQNVMSYLEMLPPSEEIPIPNKIHIELNYFHSRHGGIQTLCKKENEFVRAGETLGMIHDLFGEPVEEMRAPYDGIVIGFWSVPVIHPGAWWYLYGKILKE